MANLTHRERLGGERSTKAVTAEMAALPGIQLVQQAFDYWTDAWQRSVLFLDVLRQRGNNYFERAAQQAPNLLLRLPVRAHHEWARSAAAG